MTTKQTLSWRQIKEIKAQNYQYEQDLAGFKTKLEKLNEVIKYDPDNDNAIKQKELLEEAIREFTIELESNKAKLPADDLSEKKAEKPAVKPKIEIVIGDHVLVHRNGEQKMTLARVVSVTGGANNLVYQVKFKDKETAQVRADECRPATKINELNAEKKRKAEGEPNAQNYKTSTVISAAPQIREPSMATDGPDRPAKIPRKLGSEKKLEKSRTGWQAFMSKQKPKESMFRTGEGVNARVGVVGSGKQMTADQKRIRHVHGEIEED